MQVKISKTFAKYVDRLIKSLGIAEEARLSLVGPMSYPGGTMFNPDAEMDYDYKTDKYRVIQVFYPYEYYAEPLTISTSMLNEAVRRMGPKITVEQLNDALRDMIEV